MTSSHSNCNERVIGSGGISAPPLTAFSTSFPLTIEGRPETLIKPQSVVGLYGITPGYFAAMRIPILKGRVFTDSDRKDTDLRVIIDDALAQQYWPNQNPIGLPYSMNAPFQITTDLKINRWFKVAGRRFDLSLQGTNIFNNYLPSRIDAITGKGYVWGEGQFDPTYVHSLNDYVKTGTVDDPSNYGPGSQWRLQFDVDL